MLGAMTHPSRALNLDIKQSFFTPKSDITKIIFMPKRDMPKSDMLRSDMPKSDIYIYSLRTELRISDF